MTAEEKPVYETKIIRIDLPNRRRIICISDIHGHRRYLRNLLKQIDFSKNDILFILGDMVEKGPDSLGTIREIMKLSQGGNVYPLMGNVELWQYDMLTRKDQESHEILLRHRYYSEKNWGSGFFLEMCREMGIPADSVEEVRAAKERLQQVYAAELDFIGNLPTIIETQKFIFVHGGLPEKDLGLLKGTEPWDCLKNDGFEEKGMCFSKYVIVGHWPVVLLDDRRPVYNPKINRRQKIVSIDGGCGIKQAEQLNAFIIPEVESEAFYHEFYDELPRIRALTGQKESIYSLNLRYVDNKVDILESGGEYTEIRHRSSGYEMEVPNCFLYESDGEIVCDDYTDYCPEIQPGDILSVVMKTSRGYWMKHRGVCGWYYGKAESYSGIAVQKAGG